MAQECGFFNARLVGEKYDRVYLAEQFAAYFASFIGNGVFGSSMQQLKVLAQDTANMSVKVGSGQAWINGWWYRNTDAYTLDIDVAGGALSRIDLIVLRWGQTERDMWLQVIKGKPSANPVAPSISRGADYYDLQLATVSIPAGAIKITQAQITDTRLDNSVCGLVTGVVDQIDTTDLYNQFETYFAEFKQLSESEFDSWFEDVKGTLDSDAAGNLKNQIDAANEKIDTNTSAIDTLNNSSIKKLTKEYTSSDAGNILTGIPLTTQCIAVLPSQETGDNTIFFSLHKGNMNQWLVGCYYLQEGRVVHMAKNYTVTLDIYYIGTIT